MLIRDRILVVLKDGPHTTKEIQTRIPDKHPRNLAATISNNPTIFLRLEKGLVGIRNRDEPLVTGRPVNYDQYCLYKKVYNALREGPLTLEELYRLLPEEKKVSIRATATVRKDLFIRLCQGIIGRKGRDERLIVKVKKPLKVKKKTKNTSIGERLMELLSDRPMHISEIITKIRKYPRKSISSILTRNPNFVRQGDGFWLAISEDKPNPSIDV